MLIKGFRHVWRRLYVGGSALLVCILVATLVWSQGASRWTSPVFQQRVIATVNASYIVTAFGAAGDGVTNDTAAIQKALDIVSTPKVINIPPGTFCLNNNLRIRYSGVKLIGAGMGLTILKGCTLWTTAPTSSRSVPAFINLVDAAMVVGDEIPATYVTDIEITGITFQGFGLANQNGQPKAISSLCASRISIHHNRFIEFGVETIWPSGCDPPSSSRWNVSDNVFERNGYSGSSLGAASVVNFGINEFIISRNIFDGAYIPIGISGVASGVVSDNYMKNCITSCIFIGGDAEASNVAVTGNVINSIVSAIGGNLDAISVGVVENKTTSGVVVSANSVNLKTTTASLSTALGISVYGTPNVGNIISNNTIVLSMDANAPAASGIAVTINANAQVSGNTVRLLSEVNAGHAGIGASTGGGGVFSFNRVYGVTRANSGYAYDWSTGVNVISIGNMATEGKWRLNQNIDNSSLDNMLVNGQSGAVISLFPALLGSPALGGSGSPEGIVSAPIGSTWNRTNGGAGTTLYVKESGTGNTGWIAK